MTKWYQWLYLALFCIAEMIVSCFKSFESKNYAAIFMGIMSGLMVVLGIVQFICEKKGEQGIKIFKYIRNIVILLLVVFVGYLIVDLVFLG